MSLKVLVVDDTVLYRTVISQALGELPQVEVVGKAANGKTALMRIKALQPDLVTLDVEMPEMGGLEVLEVIRREELDCGVVMISSVTKAGGDATVKALELGAFDFITKPDSGGSMEENRRLLREELAPLVEGYRKKLEKTGREIKPADVRLRERPPQKGTGREKEQPGRALVERMERIAGRQKPLMVTVGVSTGGPAALGEVIPRLPGKLGVPVLVVQHMPAFFTQSLAKSLNNRSALTVKEAEDGEALRADTVYIAPGGRQMRLGKGAAGGYVLQVTDDPPENNCRPAVDYLFRSVANLCPGRATAVIMTGMGRDGTMGVRLMRRRGGVVIAQDEATSTVFGMPMEVIKAGAADLVLPLPEIAAAITESVRG